MSNKLLRIKIIQPAFDKLYKKYEKAFSPLPPKPLPTPGIAKNVNKEDKPIETISKLDNFINQIDTLEGLKHSSAEHIRWVSGIKKFLKEVFNEKSEYYIALSSFTWTKKGIIGGPSRPAESLNPQLGIDRLKQEAYLEQLNMARGILLAAKDELEEVGLPSKAIGGAIIFPKDLLEKLPIDIKEVCEEFNYNFINGKRWSALLLLRRLLPLSIVRKFQKMNKENEIKVNGDYLDTKNLLGKVEKYLKENKVYRDILNYKILTDSSQHSYTFSPELTDVEGAALKIRLLFGDLFSS